MRFAWSADSVRAAEEPLLASLPDATLMMRASTALARTCASLLRGVYAAPVVLLVGTGNNGGDTLYAGAALARRGAAVSAILLGDAHAAGLAAFHAAGGRSLSVADRHRVTDLIDSAELVVDGMLGIGARGALRSPASSLASLVSTTPATVVAVDVPSGVEASTGEVAGDAVRADVTVTFGCLKPGLLVAPGAHFAGVVEVVDIGLEPPQLDAVLGVLDAEDARVLIPTPTPESDKYQRGVVGIVAGSDSYTGAAVLAVGGALRAGAGMVRFVSLAHPAEMVRQRWPEAVVTAVDAGDSDAVLGAGRVQAWVIGSGLGTDDEAAAIVAAVLGTDLPVVVDADAISVVAARPELVKNRSAATVLTPHAGEFARLRSVDRADVEARRLHHASLAAAELGVTVLLKGSTTVVASGDDMRVDPMGSSYLGTAGSGDVLSGIIGALLAGGLNGMDAASVGTMLHSLAGTIAVDAPAASITAMQIADAVPDAVRLLGS